MKKTILSIVVILIFSFAITAFDKKQNDCPSLSLSEQGDMLNEFLHDYEQWSNFKKSLKQNGYCLSQFGLK